MAMKRKAQFYLIAGLAFVLLFFTMVPHLQPLVTTPSSDLGYLARNMQKELPHALTLGLNESSGVPTLVNFTRFSARVMAERAINFTPVWVVTGNLSQDLNVTVGNFLGANTTVTVNVTGEDVQSIAVADNSTNSSAFTSVAAAFNISIGFRDQNETFVWVRDKVNLYAFVNLTRFSENLQVNVSA